MYVEHKNSVIRSTVHRLDGSAINSKPPIGLAHVVHIGLVVVCSHP